MVRRDIDRQQRLSAKRALLRFGDAVGLFAITSILSGRSPKILMYHRFARHGDGRRLGVDELEAQVKALRDDRYNVISMRDLSARLAAGRPVEPKTVVITVDDGYEDFYTWAYPVFARYEIPVTVYVASDFIDQKIWLWPDIIEYILATAASRPLFLQLGRTENIFSLHSAELRRVAWSTIGTYCLSLSNRDKHAFIQQLSLQLDVPIPETPVQDCAAMNWEQLREMSAHGIEIGGHTCTHPVLTSLSLSEAETEIRESKARIEHCLDRAAYSFAYPNGTRVDYDEEIKAFVKAAGYSSACVAFADANVTKDLFELRRYPVSGNRRHFKKVVCGIEYLTMCVAEARCRLSRPGNTRRVAGTMADGVSSPVTEPVRNRDAISERSV